MVKRPADDALAVGVVTASLLHEIRQPLFAIKATAQLGLAGADVGPCRRILEHVAHLEEILALCGAVGDTAVPEALFDLNASVRSAVDLLAHRGRDGGVELALDLAPDGLLVRGHAVAARQVTINLLQNAYDALEDVPARRIVVRTVALRDRVRLEVADSGPGVPPLLRDALFEPFFTTKAPGRGSGLGLFIARQLVEAAHGEVRVTCPDDGGTRVEVELPRAA